MNNEQKRQAIFIAPLQPITLASVKTWGNSWGAGRKVPAKSPCQTHLLTNRLQKYCFFLTYANIFTFFFNFPA